MCTTTTKAPTWKPKHLYAVTDWTDKRLQATSSMAEGCLERRLELFLG